LIQKSSSARRGRVAPCSSAGLGQLPIVQRKTQHVELYRQETRSHELIVSSFVQIRQLPQPNAEEERFAVKPRCPQKGLKDFTAHTAIPQVARVTTQARILNSGEPYGKQLHVWGADQIIDLGKISL
jgi:hypothetical protein